MEHDVRGVLRDPRGPSARGVARSSAPLIYTIMAVRSHRMRLPDM